MFLLLRFTVIRESVHTPLSSTERKFWKTSWEGIALLQPIKKIGS